MRQLIRMFLFDIRSTMKGFMGVYIAIAPALILLILRFFVPSVESTSATVAVVANGPNAVHSALIGELEQVADVVRYDSIDAMEDRLRGTGSAEGLYWDPDGGQYVSVLERNIPENTAFSTGARVVRRFYLEQHYPQAEPVISFTATVPGELSGRTENSPVATMGGAIFMSFLSIIAGFVSGLGIVNDKEFGTDRAIRVSPVTLTDYYVGKSIFPLLILIAYPIVALLVLGLMDTNILQVYVLCVGSFAVSLFVGLLVGALAKNQTEAIGVAKTLATVLMLAILGGALLPENWQWVTYWLPIYWLYNAMEGVFTLTATWGDVAWKTGLMVGISGFYFLIMRKRIAAGLS
jgi:ABC-2 type transport system permease protein